MIKDKKKKKKSQWKPCYNLPFAMFHFVLAKKKDIQDEEINEKKKQKTFSFSIVEREKNVSKILT